MEWLADLISPDSEYMKPWASDSTTLYLMVMLYYIIRKTIVGTGNMKNTALMFRVQLSGAHYCINRMKYKGGSKKSAQQ